jgi:ABC-type nitrate/sulfonate/bicarbonate transport system permease component
VFWWLFLASLVLGLIGFAPAVLVAIIAAVIACTHPTRIG